MAGEIKNEAISSSKLKLQLKLKMSFAAITKMLQQKMWGDLWTGNGIFTDTVRQLPALSVQNKTE